MARRSPEMSGFWDWLWSKPEKAAASSPVPPQVDLYRVIGVSPDASQDEIKQAFREQALKFHPDRNPDDKVAEQKYSEISAAYAILGDEAQRAAYDAARARSMPQQPQPERRGPGGGGLIPRSSEEMTQEKKKEKPLKKLDTKSMMEKMFGGGKEEEAKGSVFDVLHPGQPKPPPPRIPSPGTMFASLNPSASRIPMAPGVDVPDQSDIWKIVDHWPLEQLWDLVRGERMTPEFHRAGAIALDALAGAGQQPAEWDLAEIFDIPVRQVQDFVNTKGREAFYVNVIYPLFDTVTAIMDKMKPPDIPGKFFLDWDPNGRVIELIYAENIRPGR